MRHILFSLSICVFILTLYAPPARAQCTITPAGDHLCGGGAAPAQAVAPVTPAGTAIGTTPPPGQTDYSDPGGLVAATPGVGNAVDQNTVAQPTPIALGSSAAISIPPNGTTAVRFTPDASNASFSLPPGTGPVRVWISSIAGYNSSQTGLTTSQDYFQDPCYAILNDPSTPDLYVEDRINIATPQTILAGSSDGISVPSDIVEGEVDLRANGDTLQNWLGIRSGAAVTNTQNLSTYTDLQDLLTTEAADFATGDGVSLTFTDPSLGIPAETVALDLSDINTLYPIDGITITDSVDQLVAAINAQVISPGFGVTASRSATGRLVIESTADITIDGTTGLNPMGATGLAALGLTGATTAATDPWVDITLVGGATQRVSIEPGDTEVTFLAKLNALTGIVAEMDPLTGFVTIHAADSFTSIEIEASNHQSDGTGTSGLAAGTGMLTTFFGSEQPMETVGETDPNGWWNNCAVQPGQPYYINIQNLSGQQIDTTLTYGPQAG